MSRRRLGHQNIFGSQSGKMNKRLLSALILLPISFAALSQDRTQHLSLQEAIAASITSNNAIKLSALVCTDRPDKISPGGCCLSAPSVYFLYGHYQPITR
jgi:hypothetical protein